MIPGSRLSVAFLVFPICLAVFPADDNSTSLLALKKEQTEIRYVVATIKGNCHASQAGANRDELSVAETKYALASAAYNVWLEEVRQAVLSRSLLRDEKKALWSKANEATNAFVDFSLKTCGGVQPGDPVPEPLRSGQLLVSFEDMQAMVKKLKSSSPNQRKSAANLLAGDEWAQSAFSSEP